MHPIPIRPHLYRQLGPAHGVTFCFVTNSDIASSFTIEEDGSYDSYCLITYDVGDDFSLILRNTPQPAHILVVSPKRFFSSESAIELGKRKLLVMPCNSTPASLEAIAYFIDVLEKTDPESQEKVADRFFSIGQSSKQLHIVDETCGTVAVFDHLSDDYEWFQQAGYVDWGGQQLAPPGEISVLPLEVDKFHEDRRLAINGEIAFRGYPLVHAGKVPFPAEEQERTYRDLSHMQEHPVIAKVENGVITNLTATHPHAEPAAQRLRALIERDLRYSIIWEIGFAINSSFDILPGNVAMNELYGGKNGAVHWGLGLMPYTQYHMDIICPDLSVVGRGEEVLIGKKLRRNLSSLITPATHRTTPKTLRP